MRDLSENEIGAISGGDAWLTVSCCSVNVFGVDVNFNGFSVSFPNSNTSIGTEYQQANGGMARG
jgi:hypothetical protein